ncbi:MAG: hypothetical protein [Olavius algarvensis Gamma 1 endosymbiont]|nr:MAG: hypothetical protein [Olavius algarvensis Gamma 1 endosymbiont]
MKFINIRELSTGTSLMNAQTRLLPLPVLVPELALFPAKGFVRSEKFESIHWVAG